MAARQSAREKEEAHAKAEAEAKAKAEAEARARAEAEARAKAEAEAAARAKAEAEARAKAEAEELARAKDEKAKADALAAEEGVAAAAEEDKGKPAAVKREPEEKPQPAAEPKAQSKPEPKRDPEPPANVSSSETDEVAPPISEISARVDKRLRRYEKPARGLADNVFDERPFDEVGAITPSTDPRDYFDRRQPGEVDPEFAAGIDRMPDELAIGGKYPRKSKFAKSRFGRPAMYDPTSRIDMRGKFDPDKITRAIEGGEPVGGLGWDPRIEISSGPYMPGRELTPEERDEMREASLRFNDVIDGKFGFSKPARGLKPDPELAFTDNEYEFRGGEPVPPANVFQTADIDPRDMVMDDRYRPPSAAAQAAMDEWGRERIRFAAPGDYKDKLTRAEAGGDLAANVFQSDIDPRYMVTDNQYRPPSAEAIAAMEEWRDNPPEIDIDRVYKDLRGKPVNALDDYYGQAVSGPYKGPLTQGDADKQRLALLSAQMNLPDDVFEKTGKGKPQVIKSRFGRPIMVDSRFAAQGGDSGAFAGELLDIDYRDIDDRYYPGREWTDEARAEIERLTREGALPELPDKYKKAIGGVKPVDGLGWDPRIEVSSGPYMPGRELTPEERDEMREASLRFNDVIDGKFDFSKPARGLAPDPRLELFTDTEYDFRDNGLPPSAAETMPDFQDPYVQAEIADAWIDGERNLGRDKPSPVLARAPMDLPDDYKYKIKQAIDRGEFAGDIATHMGLDPRRLISSGPYKGPLTKAESDKQREILRTSGFDLSDADMDKMLRQIEKSKFAGGIVDYGGYDTAIARQAFDESVADSAPVADSVAPAAVQQTPASAPPAEGGADTALAADTPAADDDSGGGAGAGGAGGGSAGGGSGGATGAGGEAGVDAVSEEGAIATDSVAETETPAADATAQTDGAAADVGAETADVSADGEEEPEPAPVPEWTEEEFDEARAEYEEIAEDYGEQVAEYNAKMEAFTAQAEEFENSKDPRADEYQKMGEDYQAQVETYNSDMESFSEKVKAYQDKPAEERTQEEFDALQAEEERLKAAGGEIETAFKAVSELGKELEPYFAARQTAHEALIAEQDALTAMGEEVDAAFKVVEEKGAPIQAWSADRQAKFEADRDEYNADYDSRAREVLDRLYALRDAIERGDTEYTQGTAFGGEVTSDLSENFDYDFIKDKIEAIEGSLGSEDAARDEGNLEWLRQQAYAGERATGDWVEIHDSELATQGSIGGKGRQADTFRDYLQDVFNETPEGDLADSDLYARLTRGGERDLEEDPFTDAEVAQLRSHENRQRQLGEGGLDARDRAARRAVRREDYEKVAAAEGAFIDAVHAAQERRNAPLYSAAIKDIVW